jgi:eukaryotic-like serine/threonine-protein kinase
MQLSPGDIVADKYRIERLLGEGGMGTVYAANNQLTGRSVALKWLRPDLSLNAQYVERLMREARVAGRLDHPNIVNVFDAGFHSGSAFLVMELLRGESFDSWLRRGPQPAGTCLALLMPALRGVAAAHAAGVIHRDLKPDNIFLCTDSGGFITQTKVLDFGIAKDINEGMDKHRSLTSPGALIGTIHYMAPEQVRSARSVDTRCDVYALGVILYHALSGSLPFGSESLGELIIEIAESKPEPLDQRCPELPPELSRTVMRAMSRDPATRFQSVAELARALEPWAGGIRFDSREFLPSGEISTVFDSHTHGSSVAVAKPTAPASRGIPLFAWAPLALLAIGATVWFAWPKGSSTPPSEDPTLGAGSARPAPSAAPETHPFVAPVDEPDMTGPTPTANATESAQPAASAPHRTTVRGPLRPPPKPPGQPGTKPPGAGSASQPPKGGRGSTYEDNPYVRH